MTLQGMFILIHVYGGSFSTVPLKRKLIVRKGELLHKLKKRRESIGFCRDNNKGEVSQSRGLSFGYGLIIRRHHGPKYHKPV